MNHNKRTFIQIIKSLKANGFEKGLRASIWCAETRNFRILSESQKLLESMIGIFYVLTNICVVGLGSPLTRLPVRPRSAVVRWMERNDDGRHGTESVWNSTPCIISLLANHFIVIDACSMIPNAIELHCSNEN